MDRWWPDGTETGTRLWQGVMAIVAVGCALGLAQNALVRMGSHKEGLAWRYSPPTLDSLDDVRKADADGKAAKPEAHAEAPAAQGDGRPAHAETQPGGSHPLPPDMNDPLQLGAAAAGVPDVPDVGRPIKIEMAKVKSFFDAKAATIVDARDPGEYADGHIPGAINLPYDQVVTDAERLEKFDAKGKPIIVYCGGGTCELSMNLGFALVQAGQKKVLVYTGGWPEWSAAGYPAAKGATPEGAS